MANPNSGNKLLLTLYLMNQGLSGTEAWDKFVEMKEQAMYGEDVSVILEEHGIPATPAFCAALED